MRQVFKKTATGFVPDCEESQKLFDKVPPGAEVMVEFTKKRSYPNHKRFFQLRNMTFDIQDSFDNEELWRKQLLIMAGHFDEVIVPLPSWLNYVTDYLEKYIPDQTPNKRKVIDKIKNAFGLQYWAKSIKYEKIDEIEFNEMLKNAVNEFIKHYAPEMTDVEFEDIVRLDT